MISLGAVLCVSRNKVTNRLEHENAKAELKALMPEDAKEAIGHGIHGRRSKSGAVTIDLLQDESGHAPVQ
jgi:hypothetical protein